MCWPTDETISNLLANSLITLLKQNTLKNLALSGNKNNTFTALSVLASELEVNTSLTNLSFGGLNLKDIDAYRLAEILKKNNTLTALSLDKNSITPEAENALIEAIKTNTTLEYFSFYGAKLKAIQPILESNKQTGKNKKIQANLKTRNDIIALLKSMGTEPSQIQKKELQQKLNQVDTLILKEEQLTELHIKHLSEALVSNHTVTSLNLDYNPIGNGITYLLHALAKNKTLTTLHTEEANIKIEGDLASLFIDILSHNTTLKKLYLSNYSGMRTKNKIDKASIEQFSSLLKINKNLTTLDLPFDDLILEPKAEQDIAKQLSDNRQAKTEAVNFNPPPSSNTLPNTRPTENKPTSQVLPDTESTESKPTSEAIPNVLPPRAVIPPKATPSPSYSKKVFATTALVLSIAALITLSALTLPILAIVLSAITILSVIGIIAYNKLSKEKPKSVIQQPDTPNPDLVLSVPPSATVLKQAEPNVNSSSSRIANVELTDSTPNKSASNRKKMD